MHTRRSFTRAMATVIAAALLQPGCAFMRRGDDAELEPGTITVAVDNRNWSQITVYAEVRGQSRRIGEVPGATSATLEIPEMFTGRIDLRLVATPLASSNRYRTGVIVARPGATVNLVIENDLRLSSWNFR